MNNHLPDLIEEYQAIVGRSVSQKEIAIEADVPQGTFSRYLNGRIDSLNLNIEYKLCRFFTNKLGRLIDRGDLFSFEFEPMN